MFLAFLGLNVFAAPLPEGNDAHISKRGATLNAFLGFLLDNLPVTSETITKSTAIITNLSKLLGTLTGAQDTYNEAGGACKEWTVVFARGTSEPGNVSFPEHLSQYDRRFAKCSSMLGGNSRWTALV